MLSHRSGIGSITSDPTYRRWSTTEQSRQQMIEIVSRQPKRFEPGKRAEYSNSNYVLLGLIIEKVTDSDYAEQLKTRICEPAKLTRTEYMTKAGPKNNVARAFFRADGQWKPQTETHPSVPHGAGAIMSTATDLIRFAEALFAGKLISKVSLKKMKPDGLGMGSGLFAYPYGVKTFTRPRWLHRSISVHAWLFSRRQSRVRRHLQWDRLPIERYQLGRACNRF